MVQMDQETRDLLIRLDEKVTAILKNQEHTTAEVKGLDGRVRLLEDWRTEVRGSVRGAGLSWKIGSVLIGAALGILGAIGFQFAVVPKDAPTTKPETAAATTHEE